MNSDFATPFVMLSNRHLCLAFIFVLAAVTGCGESQQDLFMKHAQRDRGGVSNDDEETQTANTAAPSPVATEVSSNIPKRSSDPVIQSSQGDNPRVGINSPGISSPLADEDDSEADLSEVVGIKPIDERRPEDELSVAERRRRAFENLTKINEAILTYVVKNKQYPRSYRTNAGGVPTLSWRVELLPYLGYEDLYKKFDFTRAWNMPPNKELLDYIPDEYVSPERFDVKTNYQLPIDSAFIFGENRGISPSMIDDGAENTIMLLEVNDAHAVNWTEPKDFKPKSVMNMSPYLGKLRGDGTFALWASGFPVLLETSVSNQQLFQAMTYKKIDALRARDIHRAITVEEAEADLEMESDLNSSVATSPEDTSPATLDFKPPSGISEESFAREPIPTSEQLIAAQDKLRKIFRDEINAAKASDEKAKLASKLLDTAQDLDADPAGAYALQQAALRLAIDSGDGGSLIRAIDQRVARFEVDSFRENIKWIQAFGQATASRDSSTVSGKGILSRAIPVIYAGIHEDEYMLASSVARIAGRFTSNGREDKVGQLLTRLRTQLGTAKREYEQSVDDLNRYRIDPDDRAAGAAFGTFLCFIKGDWKRGLELIAQGKEGDLVEVARMDLRGASQAIDQVAIADTWWELSRRGSGAYRQGAQDRAVMWYSSAYERLPDSLDRIHVKNRLQEAGETDGRSPVALCLQLADEIGVELGQSLTSIAASGQRSNQNRDDDD